MQVISVSQLNIQALVKEIKQGKTVVYPTETCYGLGCDPTNPTAVEKIFHIKQRPENKPMLLVFPQVEMVQEYVLWNETLEALAKKYWPGPVTVVAPLKSNTPLSPQVIHHNGTIAFRVSSHPLVTELTQALGKPLISTSSNIAGEDNPYDISTILHSFETQTFQPDILIDGGPLPLAPPSTIVTVDNGKLIVLRQGGIVIE